jgi:hypothetical protein
MSKGRCWCRPDSLTCFCLCQLCHRGLQLTQAPCCTCQLTLPRSQLLLEVTQLRFAAVTSTPLLLLIALLLLRLLLLTPGRVLPRFSPLPYVPPVWQRLPWSRLLQVLLLQTQCMLLLLVITAALLLPMFRGHLLYLTMLLLLLLLPLLPFL